MSADVVRDEDNAIKQDVYPKEAKEEPDGSIREVTWRDESPKRLDADDVDIADVVSEPV